MKKIFSSTVLFLLTFCSSYINAESYLCISEAIVGIKNGKSIPTKVTNYSDTDKFILQKVNNKWSLKEIGDYARESIWPCATEYYCGTHIGGVKDAIPHNIFFRSGNVYTRTSAFMDGDKGLWTNIILQRGTCEAL